MNLESLIHGPAGVTEAQHKKAYAYKATFMDTEHGPEVMEALRNRFYNRLSFDVDPYVTAFYEGQRSIIIHLLTMIDMADINKYPILEETPDNDYSTSSDTRNNSYL